MNMSTYGVGRKIYSTKKEKKYINFFFQLKTCFCSKIEEIVYMYRSSSCLFFLSYRLAARQWYWVFRFLNVSIPNMISIWHLVFHFFCHSTILLFNPCFDFCFIILACFLGFWGGCVWFFFLHSSFFLLLSCRSSPWLKQ